jgi:hypothetical protein
VDRWRLSGDLLQLGYGLPHCSQIIVGGSQQSASLYQRGIELERKRKSTLRRNKLLHLVKGHANNGAVDEVFQQFLRIV